MTRLFDEIDIKVHSFTDRYICESCIVIAYYMIGDNDIKLINVVEEALLSTVYITEKELVVLRMFLVDAKVSETSYDLIKENMRLVNELKFDFVGVNPVLQNTLMNLNK